MVDVKTFGCCGEDHTIKERVVDMVTSVKTVLQKYTTISGRALRSEYWWWTLAIIIVSVILGKMDSALFLAIDPATGKQTGASILSFVFTLAILIPNICVIARRLHDINKSGWWMLVSIVPILGLILFIFWAATKGTAGDNRFGPDPLVSQQIG